MSRCVIIGGGPYRDPQILARMISPEDTVIAADSGLALAMDMQVTPTVLVADFDSISKPSVTEDVKIISLPQKKDDTDTAVAMREGYESGCREFLLLGCTGGRLDHYYAALTVAARYAQMGCNVVLADEQNEIHVLTPGEYAFSTACGSIVSLFAFGGEVTGLSAEHLAYSLDRFTLSPLDPLCVSNAATSDEISLRFDTGILLLYFSND